MKVLLDAGVFGKTIECESELEAINETEEFVMSIVTGKCNSEMRTVGDMIDKVFSHNEIIALWEERKSEKGSPKYRIYKGMAHALPKEHKDRIFVRVFGTLVENVTESDVINILVTPKIVPCCNADLEKQMQERNDMNAKRAAKLLKIAHYYGEEKQVCKLIEELGEATSAASELLMRLTFREDAGKEKDIQARLEHLAAELADVQNVTEQVIALFGLELDFKVSRQAGIDKTLKRIEKEIDNEHSKN